MGLKANWLSAFERCVAFPLGARRCDARPGTQSPVSGPRLELFPETAFHLLAENGQVVASVDANSAEFPDCSPSRLSLCELPKIL